MRIRVLGPMVVAARDDVPLRERAVLGVLVVRAGGQVSLDDIADAIWGERPPATYRKVVQGCVVRLRRGLGGDAIITGTGGYCLSAAAGDIDATRFEQLIDSAHAAAEDGDHRRTLALADEALELWRGDPLPELPEWPPAITEARRLTELRMSVEDLQIEAMSRIGRAAPAAARAEALAMETPYREERWALLARAQYAAGRQADALSSLRMLRATLADELGIDPLPEIAALESAILRNDPSLELPSSLRSGRWLFSRAGQLAALALAVVALLAIGGALHQRSVAARASEEAAGARDATVAVRVGEFASTQEDPSVALALAAQALSLDDSAAVRSRALTTLGNFSDLLSTGRAPSQAWPTAASTAESPDGRTTAIAHPASIEIVVDGRAARRLTTPTNDPTALAFSPDGRYLAAGMSELGFAPTGSTVVWDLGSGARIASFDSGEGAVYAHVFAPDGTSVWSYGADGIHQWDLTSSHALARTTDGDPVAFRTGRLVLSVRDPSVAPWIEYACGLAGRSLTEDEWREYVGERPYAPTC